MNRLRGNIPATIDAKGRLKIPTAFRRFIEEQYGRELYITSFRGESVLVYPLPVWTEIETRMASLARSHPSIQRFKRNTSYFGLDTTMDPQGRVLVPAALREYRKDLAGDVSVLGNYDHLVVWRTDQIRQTIESAPFSEEDLAALADLGL